MVEEREKDESKPCSEKSVNPHQEVFIVCVTESRVEITPAFVGIVPIGP